MIRQNLDRLSSEPMRGVDAGTRDQKKRFRFWIKRSNRNLML